MQQFIHITAKQISRLNSLYGFPRGGAVISQDADNRNSTIIATAPGHASVTIAADGNAYEPAEPTRLVSEERAAQFARDFTEGT